MGNETRWFAVRSTIAGLAGIAILATVTGLTRPVVAQENDIGEGKRIWAEKAQCVECHGWAGNGDRTSLHSGGQAPSLRLTQLSRDEIRMTIQCGRPATPMPHFDRFAYTDKRCYDMSAADLGDNVPDRGSVTLQAYEIDALTNYVAAKIKGAGPVTRGQCFEFFQAGGDYRCNVYPEK